MTFLELTARYLHGHLRGTSSYAFYCRLYKQYFSGWSEHPTKAMIRQWHRDHARTPAHANKGLGYLKAMYNWAINESLWEAENPAAGIRRHRTWSRTRTLTARELALLMNSLDFLPRKFRVLLIVLMTTGCRLSEALTMEWAHVNATAGSWFKPMTKNGQAQTLPLPRQTLEAIATLPHGPSPYVFPGVYGRHLSRAGAEKTWWGIRTLLQMPDVRLHDFRRTLATRLHEQGEPELLIKRILHHHVDATNVTAVYIRPSFDRQAQALQRHADSLWALIQEVSNEQPALPFLSVVPESHPRRRRTDYISLV